MALCPDDPLTGATVMDAHIVPVNPGHPTSPARTATVNRRGLWSLAACAGATLTLDGVVDASAVQAATRKLKLSDVSEFTTACNFCSCGCGMIAATRDGKLLTLEGDYDHVVNGGSLCV